MKNHATKYENTHSNTYIFMQFKLHIYGFITGNRVILGINSIFS